MDIHNISHHATPEKVFRTDNIELFSHEESDVQPSLSDPDVQPTLSDRTWLCIYTSFIAKMDSRDECFCRMGEV